MSLIWGVIMDMNKIYKNLTNVEIDSQIKLWNERGKGYYGEFLVFSTLYKSIHDYCKYLMNLNVPSKNNKTTEIDLVLIHQSGIYVFEVKHYKGTIYGNNTNKTWTQFFRTTSNSTFNNPILQNQYHIESLKKFFPDTPIYSVIVFTNQECDLRITNNDSSILVTNINELLYKFKSFISKNPVLYTVDELDLIFNKLSKFSNIQETVTYNGKEEPFNFWISHISEDYNNQLTILKNEKDKIKKEYAKKNILYIFIVIITILFSITVSISNKESFDSKLLVAKNEYNEKIKNFENKFKHVDQLNNIYITQLHEYFNVSDVNLNSLGYNSSTFSAKISKNPNNNTYGMVLTENSKYIVMKYDGSIYEYNVFGKHLSYNRYYNTIGYKYRDEGILKETQFSGINPSEISYIKLTNIELINLTSFNNAVIKENLELELYLK